jgi:uncharacterized membrane protein YedE/YeeE
VRARVVPLLSGILFALGLCLSGMTRPAKVSAFLDVTGAWDPSLALVMAGAVAVYLLAFGFARRRAAVVAGALAPPNAPTSIDGRLLIGAALFGVGWGASGFCPGPALVSLGAASPSALLFVPAMIAGMALVSRIDPPRSSDACR